MPDTTQPAVQPVKVVADLHVVTPSLSGAAMPGTTTGNNVPLTGNTGAVNFDAGLVKQDAQIQMQAADAAPEKPAVVIGGVAAPVVPVPAAPYKLVHTNTIEILPFITLSYGNPYMIDLKNELRAIPATVNGVSEDYNFYNPFTKANPVKNIGEGVLRRIFSKIVSTIRQVKNTEVTYLVDEGRSVNDLLHSYAWTLVESIRRKFPLSPSDPVLELETDEGNVILTFGDLFSVTAWASSIVEDVASTTATVSINIAVNAGAFYDSQEPHAFVSRALTFIQNMLTKLDAVELMNPYVAIAVNAESLRDDATRDLVDMLLSPDMGFSIATRASVVRGKEDWIPAAAADLLFVDNTDLLFFTHAFQEIDEDDGEEEVAGDDDGE